MRIAASGFHESEDAPLASSALPVTPSRPASVVRSSPTRLEEARRIDAVVVRKRDDVGIDELEPGVACA